MASKIPRPQLVREREGDPSHGTSRKNTPNHPMASPDKPSLISPLASEIWDDYVKFSAPGLIRLIHAMALWQLCEDKALEIRLRRALAKCESRLMEAMVKSMMANPPEPSMSLSPGGEEVIQSPESMCGDPLAIISQDKDQAGIFRVLNQVVMRVQRQEQQFGLTPQAATRVDIAATDDAEDSFEDDLCG